MHLEGDFSCKITESAKMMGKFNNRFMYISGFSKNDGKSHLNVHVNSQNTLKYMTFHKEGNIKKEESMILHDL